MGKYIKKFDTDQKRVEYEDGDGYIEPYVSLVNADNGVHYNKIKTPYIKLKFNLSQPSNERVSLKGDLGVIGGSSQADGLLFVKEIKIDGQTISIENDITINNIVDVWGVVVDAYFYNFEISGEHTIEYFLNAPIAVDGVCAAIGKCNFAGFLEFDSKITNLEIELKDIIEIGNCAFALSNINSITVPKSVENIDDFAFVHCTGLPAVDNIMYVDTYAVGVSDSTLSTYTFKEGTTAILGLAFGPCENITNITIPSSIVRIGEGAFSNSSTAFTSVTLNTNAATNGAFKGITSITDVTVGNNVTSIGDTSFSGCTSLTGVTIPDSVTSIGMSAFTNCYNLTSITIPDSVIIIGPNAFSRCSSLTSITLPNNVTQIYTGAFSSCTSLMNIIIPESITSISDGLLSNCTGLTSVTIPDSVTSIGMSAFNFCESLSSITIPDSVTSIGKSAFRACSSLSSITINTPIEEGTFNGCYNLSSVTIGSSVTSIGGNAFQDCGKLKNITSFAMESPQVGPNSLYGVGNNGTLIVPNDSSGYDAWMSSSSYYLGYYNWTKVEQ